MLFNVLFTQLMAITQEMLFCFHFFGINVPARLKHGMRRDCTFVYTYFKIQEC